MENINDEQVAKNIAAAEEERKASIRLDLASEANIPALHMSRARSGDLRGEPWFAALEKLIAKLGTGFTIALTGIRGNGKTQLGVCLMREQIHRLKSARFTTAMDIFLSIKESYRIDSERSEKDIVEDLCEPKLLVIDEHHERGDTAWEDRILIHLINRRYNSMRDTLLISNLTLEAFTNSMGLSIVSRMNETGGIILCDWESFRE